MYHIAFRLVNKKTPCLQTNIVYKVLNIIKKPSLHVIPLKVLTSQT